MRITSLVGAVAALSGLLACNRGNDSASAGGTLDTAKTSTSSPPTTTPVAASPESTTTPGGGGDAGTLAAASAGDSAEIAIARLVRLSTTDRGVKAYADELERDHGKGMSKVDAVAKRLHLTMRLPSTDTTAQETSHVIDHLKSLSGKDRDTAFVNHEIADHEHDIDEAKRMESEASAPEVKSLLHAELPELERHLADAKKLSAKLSANGSAKTK